MLLMLPTSRIILHPVLSHVHLPWMLTRLWLRG
jgi:hypothetical protein